MLRPRFIPVLLLRRDGLYKGIRFRDYKYVGDPMNAVRIFNAKNVDEIFLIDITATLEKRVPDAEFIQRVADESYMPFGVGGGIRSVDDMRRMLRAGAEKVLINSAAVENPDLIRHGAGIFGAQSITVGIDVDRSWLGGYVVMTHCGAKRTALDPVRWARDAERLGAGEILLNCIHRDGTRKGYDVEITRRVAEAVGIPVIACGGAGGSDDLDEVTAAGASAAAAGSLFVFNGPHRAVLIQYPVGPRRSAPPVTEKPCTQST